MKTGKRRTVTAAAMGAALLVAVAVNAAADLRLAVRVLPVRVSGTDGAELLADELHRELADLEGYSLFPRAGIRAVTDKLTAKGMLARDDDSDRAGITFGNALKADLLLVASVRGQGSRCRLSMVLYHVPEARSAGRRDFEASCSSDELAGLMRHAGRELLEGEEAGAVGPGTGSPVFFEAEHGRLNLRFVRILGGRYTMGSESAGDDAPSHPVEVDSFYLSTREVTRAQWAAVMGGEGASECPDCPVGSVSWNEVQAFLRKAGRLTDHKVRLPTEAEWEYAAAGGEAQQVYAGTSAAMDVKKYAWHTANAEGGTKPAGTKAPNRFGVYDMMGNVREWCADRYGADYYGMSPEKNPAGPRVGERRVVRGGGFASERAALRVSIRDGLKPGDRADDVGFRLVLDTSRAGSAKEYIEIPLVEGGAP